MAHHRKKICFPNGPTQEKMWFSIGPTQKKKLWFLNGSTQKKDMVSISF